MLHVRPLILSPGRRSAAASFSGNARANWTPDGGWSAGALADAAESSLLVINPIIYPEVSVGFERIEDLDAALPDELQREILPWDAAFLAGKAYVEYRRRGGSKQSPLPDFFIGAHAAVRDYTLLTRDARRYRTYFPTLSIIAPPSK